MERQRAEARRAWAGSGEAATETVWYGLRERVGATEFLGYETETAEGVIRAILKDGVEVETLEGGESGSLILNQTPFYGEAGGQVGDVGEISAPGFRAKVTDTRKKLGDLIVHDVTVVGGAARPGLAVELSVDHDGAHGDARQPFGDPYFARSFAHGARRSCGAEGLARFARAAALRHRPSEADQPRGTRKGRGHRQSRGAGERRSDDAAHGPRRCARLRRPRFVRREIRRRGARRLHGRDRRRPRPRAHLFDRALRRHPCSPHGRHRPYHNRWRERGRGGGEADRGQDARRSAQAPRSGRARLRRSRRAFARAGGRSRGAAGSPDRRQAQARARAGRRAGASSRWAAETRRLRTMPCATSAG